MAGLAMQAAEKSTLDPRIRRTREMLREALIALLDSKPFDTISIQEIAERATVNRATFYAHYPDREALLEDLVGSRFQELLDVRQIRFEGTCPSALKTVILAVYDFLTEMVSSCSKHRRHFEPFVQAVVQAQVEQVLFIGLEKGVFATHCPPAMLAATLSWAIYGATMSALRSGEAANPETFVEDVYSLVLPLLIPDGSAASHPE
jgi:AcrR family transcriptional regulator